MTTEKTTRRKFIGLAGAAGASLAGVSLARASNASSTVKGPSPRIVPDTVNAVLEDGTVLKTPFRRVESGRDGPVLLLSAAQHGNEVIGAEVAMRFQDICARQLLKGSVWLLPMANLLAIRSRRHSFGLGPEQNNRIHPTKVHNMQRWPGNPAGNNTERVVHALDQGVLRHCSHLMDIHCIQRMAAAETLGVNGHKPSRPLAEATTTRFLRYALPSTVPEKGMLISQMMLKRGGCAVGLELSGQFEIPERQVRIGLASMVNIGRQLGMLPGELDRVAGPRVTKTNQNSHEVKIPDTGIFVPATVRDGTRNLAAEDYVEKGDQLGHVIRETDLERVPAIAPVSGYLFVYGLNHANLADASLPAQHPYAEAGEMVATIVTV